jgi:hypothetical protein
MQSAQSVPGGGRLSPDVFLNLSCQLEDTTQQYCRKNDVPAEQGVEALLAAAAHIAVWSGETATFRRVADKLAARLDVMLRNNPEFFARAAER